MIRSEYQNLIDHSEEVLPPDQAATLRKKVERWSEYADIKEAFFTRPGDVNGEDKIRELAKQYCYSESNINNIIYTK